MNSNDLEEKNESLMELMKGRILSSYRWQEDIIKPFSKEMGITPHELEKILMRRLDMSGLEALHPRLESSKYLCILDKIDTDLKICWLSDIMEIISKEDADVIKNKIAKEVVNGKKYEDAIDDGKKELIEYLMR
jgi:energy-converting hydrogenase A subunit M